MLWPSLVLGDRSLFKSEGGGGGGGGGGENVFYSKPFPDPNLTAFMFLGHPLRSFKKIQDPPLYIISKYGGAQKTKEWK